MLRKICRIGVSIFACVAALGIASGCGGASNNDQGVSVTLLGFFAEGLEAGEDELPAGLTGLILPLDSASLEPSFPAATAFIGVQNNLRNQFFRVEGVHLSYDAQGARVAIPDDFYPVTTTVGPFVSEEGGSEEDDSVFDSTLPDSFSGENAPGNVSIAEIDVITASILEFINLNRNSFPDLPFKIAATATVTGVTSAGDRIETNPATLVIDFIPGDTSLPGTSGDDSGDDEEEE